jgi:hypothetical protein
VQTDWQSSCSYGLNKGSSKSPTHIDLRLLRGFLASKTDTIEPVSDFSNDPLRNLCNVRTCGHLTMLDKIGHIGS